MPDAEGSEVTVTPLCARAVCVLRSLLGSFLTLVSSFNPICHGCQALITSLQLSCTQLPALEDRYAINITRSAP